MSPTGGEPNATGSHDQPIRVLVPLTYAELGGSQLFLLKLIDAMPERYRFSVWLFEDGPVVAEFARRGVPCRILPRSMTRTPWGLCRLRRMLRDECPDVIYLHASRVLALLARCLRMPCVERINMSRRPEAGGWCNRFPWLDRIMTGWNTRVVAVSEAIRQQLIGRGVDASRIDVIRNFVDVDRFHRPNLRSSVRSELGLPENAVVVLNVGRMAPQKAQAAFLQIAAACLPRDERLHFLLIGEGPLRGELERQAGQIGLLSSGRFRMLPFRRDIESVYAAGDILLHTAHWDPLANVLLEALSAGLAVMATDVDGTVEVRERFPEIRLFAPGDTSAAASLLLQLAQTDAYAAADTGRSHAVRQQFGQEACVNAFERVLQKAMSESADHRRRDKDVS